MRPVILALGAGTHLAVKISRITGYDLVPVEARRFPDGETYIRIGGDVEGRDAVLVQTMHPQPNERLIEYLFTAVTAKELGARRVIGVVPYFPYARQDSRFSEGEAVSSNIVARLVEWSGTDALVTVDLHLHRYREPGELFSVPVTNLSAGDLLGEYLKRELGLDGTTVVGPDEESRQWAERVARVLGSRFVVLTKERRGAEDVEVSRVELGEDRAVIVDDIISTGATVAETVRVLRESGVREVYVACTHSLLVSAAEYRLLSVGVADLVTTDTVPNPYARVSVAPLIAEALKGMAGGA